MLTTLHVSWALQIPLASGRRGLCLRAKFSDRPIKRKDFLAFGVHAADRNGVFPASRLPIAMNTGTLARL
jgi:hypothetical protein